MRQHEIAKYLLDIADACHLVMQFTTGRTLADYRADPMLRSAVERQFEIIGEALRQALRLDPKLAERITDADRIIAFRNRLIHGYATVSSDVVWGVIEANLPRLKQEVAALLHEAGEEE
ncbi:MAG: DUF86 domain-containing protein [Armatimonadota bacterium]|nr:DUF86 domain-containing protein [Armatimonadota bacterium]MDR7452757.1 DUF86 domain-containing protein [Armatimonadota bacterium]MDR7505913.1 DUF86 domain-containing protein [Armatimonadota bacterium]